MGHVVANSKWLHEEGLRSLQLITVILTEEFRGFPQSLNANVGIVL